MSQKNLQFLKDRISLMIGNQLTYPKTLLSIAGSRPLKKGEIKKAMDCLDTCRRLAEAEFLIFIHQKNSDFAEAD